MNATFRKFLETVAAQEYQKRQIPRLKLLERERRAFGNNSNSNSAIRSGATLRFVSSSVESNPIPLAGEKYSQMCEAEKAKVRRIMQDLYASFSSAASSRFA